METANQSGPSENPSTKTNKDDREPSWLLTLRMINKTMTSNIIAMKTTPTIHSRKISQIYIVSRLTESTDPYITKPISILELVWVHGWRKDIPVSMKNLKTWAWPSSSSVAWKLELNQNNHNWTIVKPGWWLVGEYGVMCSKCTSPLPPLIQFLSTRQPNFH